MKRLNKKAQLSLEDAPSIILLVGLTFLVMATMAFIGLKYGQAIPNDLTVTVNNETGAWINGTLYTVDGASATGFNNFEIIAARNGSDGTAIGLGNITANSVAGTITNATATTWPNVQLDYRYNKQTVAGDVTDSLQVEISNNTSIAGIVLTISLVGIVLTVLIGIFIVARVRRRA